MIPANSNCNYAFILIPLPYSHCLPPFLTPSSPLTPSTDEPEACIKLEEEDSIRSTIVDPLPAVSPRAE
jgi:hypothetical protein